jgi:hypothetical protein
VRPLVVTAELDPASFARLDALRRAHFPPERNWLPAHLTLFHALPGEHEDEVRAALADAAGEVPLRFDRVLHLGRGVAFGVVSPGLLAVREALAARLATRLAPQDARPWRRPHVTVQNKVEPAAARALHDELAASFEPWDGLSPALLLWRYEGGPWTALGRFA